MSESKNTSEQVQQSLFGVEVPKKVTAAFVYAALQAAQAHIAQQDEHIASLQKQVKRLFAGSGETPTVVNVIEVADLLTADEPVAAPKSNFRRDTEKFPYKCMPCSRAKGFDYGHRDPRTVNEHVRDAQAAKKLAQYTPERIATIHEMALKEYAARETAAAGPVEDAQLGF